MSYKIFLMINNEFNKSNNESNNGKFSKIQNKIYS